MLAREVTKMSSSPYSLIDGHNQRGSFVGIEPPKWN